MKPIIRDMSIQEVGILPGHVLKNVWLQWKEEDLVCLI